MTLILLTAGVIAIVMLIMAVGVIFKNRCLRGSCGGPEVLGANGEPLSCILCRHRRDKMPSVAQPPRT